MARNPRWLRRAGVAAIACAAVPALTASPAGAAFTTAKCEGDAIAGAGASFQNLAHALWRSSQVFRNSAHCGSGAPTVDYFSVGSGAGRNALAFTTSGPNEGVRDVPAATKGSRFGASDFAVTNSQRTVIERGRPAVTGDEAKLHAVPTAVGALTVSVNFPDDCIVPSTSSRYHDPDGVAGDQDDTARFKTTNIRIEEAFAGGTTVDTWGELLDDAEAGADIVANPADTLGGGTNEKDDAACAAQPLVRVVREDSSGTTEIFKRWLQFVPSKTSGVAWESLISGSSNVRWPNDPGTSGGNAFPDESATFKNRPQNEGVASGVVENDGSIGYVELAQARSSEFNKQVRPGAPGGTPINSFQRDGTFWLPIQQGGAASTTYREPTKEPLSYKSSNNTPGGNCDSVTFTDRGPSNPGGVVGQLPGDPTGQGMETYGDWSQTLGVHSTDGYGICGLTYTLAFDDNSLAYNSANSSEFADQAAEERKARTVKDYLVAVVSPQGQDNLEDRDYAAVPASILTIAREGVASIGWNKAGDSTGGGDTGAGNTGGGDTGGGISTNTTAPTAPIAPGIPSNAFTIPSSRTTSNGVITIRVNLPGGGQVKSQATTTLLKRYTRKKNKRVTYGRATIQAGGAGIATITIKPSSAVKKALKKGAKQKVSVRLTFTPNGGTPNSQTKTVTVKGKKPKR